MAEAVLLPSVLDLLHLGDIAQEAWTLSFYYVTWLRQAWPVKVAFGYITYGVSDVTPAAVSSLLGAACYVTNGVHYAADMLDATVIALPGTIVTNHYLLVTMGDWAAQITDVFASAFETAEPLICTVFEESFLALSSAVQLVPNPIEAISLVVRFVAWAFRPLHVLSSVFIVPNVRRWVSYLVCLTPSADDVSVLLLRLPLWLDSVLLYAAPITEMMPELPSIASVWNGIPFPESLSPTPLPVLTVIPLPEFVQDVPRVAPNPMEMMPDPTEGGMFVHDPSFYLHI